MVHYAKLACNCQYSNSTAEMLKDVLNLNTILLIRMQLIRVKQIVKMWLSWMNWSIQDFQMPHQVTSSPMERLHGPWKPFFIHDGEVHPHLLLCHGNSNQPTCRVIHVRWITNNRVSPSSKFKFIIKKLVNNRADSEFRNHWGRFVHIEKMV